MKYEIFMINIIIEPKNVWENPITYGGINRWYLNKVRCKKKKNPNIQPPESCVIKLLIILYFLKEKY